MPRAIGEMNERQANTRRLNALPLEKILEDFLVSGDGITPREMMEPNRSTFVTLLARSSGQAIPTRPGHFVGYGRPWNGARPEVRGSRVGPSATDKPLRWAMIG